MQSDLFGVGNVLWETLSGERLFDGKTDVEIFKKIRACEIPPIADRRTDVPAALLAVLDTALAADPANRYPDADEFAHALGQVMKQAVGINAATALGAAVVEARRHLAGPAPAAGDLSQDVEFSTADLSVDPLPLTNVKRTAPPSSSQAVTAPELKPDKKR